MQHTIPFTLVRQLVFVTQQTSLQRKPQNIYVPFTHWIVRIHLFIQFIFLNKSSNIVYTTNSGSYSLEQFDDQAAFTPNNHLLKLRQLPNNVWYIHYSLLVIRDIDVSMVVNIDAYLFNRSLFRDTDATEFIFVPEQNTYFSSTGNATYRLKH